MSRLGLGLVALTLLAVGCGKKSAGGLPPLHPASGTVLKNGVPVEGGTVHLTPHQDIPNCVFSADVDLNGRFEVYTILTTAKNPKKNPGAPEGQYRVRYEPLSEDEKNKAVDLEIPVQISPGTNNTLKIEIFKR